MREFDQLQRAWEHLGRSDPLWAILVEDDRKGGGWDLAEFFATGSAEFDRWLSWFRENRAMPRRGRALDFGCGVGRMTQAMASHFDEVVGVDVAPSMITLAQDLNQRSASVRYVLNPRPDLSIFPDGRFDFVYSILVLQHIRPEFTRRYLTEFARVLAPGGVLAFQLPGEPRVLPADAYRCHVELLTPPPKEFATGVSTRIGVRVTNRSAHAWLLEKVFAVGNHWRRNGQVVRWDDGRAPLPALMPGESADVELLVTPPSSPGSLDLELDVVAEGIAWFSDRGASTLSFAAVVVESTAPPTGTMGDEQVPSMEMHCIPSTEVIMLLEEAGLTALQAMVSDRATAWIDHWYLAKRQTRVGIIRRQARAILPLAFRRALGRLIPKGWAEGASAGRDRWPSRTSAGGSSQLLSPQSLTTSITSTATRSRSSGPPQSRASSPRCADLQSITETIH